MRKLALTLNTLSVVLFTAFFAYTFLARAHLESLARDFVTQKTIDHSAPLIDLADSALDNPTVRILAGREGKLMRQEIATYRKDPASYIEDLTGKQPAMNDAELPPKVVAVKEDVRRYFKETLQALIEDLRIFSGSNIAAALFALMLAVLAPTPIRPSLLMFSFALLGGVVLCSWLYVDNMSFFRILTKTHMGWWYPAVLLIVSMNVRKDMPKLEVADAVPVSSDGKTA